MSGAAGAVDAAVVEAAVEVLRGGGLVALPTETYYALATDALSEPALERLLEKKGRAAAHTLSVLIDGMAMLETLVAAVPARAAAIMAAHWPGPVTLALPARAGLPAAIVSERGLVAVRWSPAALACAVVTALGRPVTATSANRSGEPPARTADEAARALEGGLPVHVVPGQSPGGAPSTLVAVDATGRLELLRAGAVDYALLQG